MTYSELHKLIDEYGLEELCQRLTYKDYIVATIYCNKSLGKDVYCLDFFGIYYNIDNYEESKKYTEERIKIIKELIITIKKAELEKDFV